MHIIYDDFNKENAFLGRISNRIILSKKNNFYTCHFCFKQIIPYRIVSSILWKIITFFDKKEQQRSKYFSLQKLKTLNHEVSTQIFNTSKQKRQPVFLNNLCIYFMILYTHTRSIPTL